MRAGALFSRVGRIAGIASILIIALFFIGKFDPAGVSRLTIREWTGLVLFPQT